MWVCFAYAAKAKLTQDQVMTGLNDTKHIQTGNIFSYKNHKDKKLYITVNKVEEKLLQLRVKKLHLLEKIRVFLLKISTWCLLQQPLCYTMVHKRALQYFIFV